MTSGGRDLNALTENYHSSSESMIDHKKVVALILFDIGLYSDDFDPSEACGSAQTFLTQFVNYMMSKNSVHLSVEAFKACCRPLIP